MASAEKEVDAFVEELFNRRATENTNELQAYFKAAIDVDEYVRALRAKAIVSASFNVPKAIEVVGKKATEGDLQACRLLFDITGVAQDSGKSATNVAAQINVNFPTLKDALDAPTVDAEIVE